jgi:hypothetical protein
MHSMSPRRSVRGVTLGVASGGVLLGHWLAYLIVDPVTSTRDAVLGSTGHAYLSAADRLGLAVTLSALGAVFLRRMIHGDDVLLPVRAVGTRLAGFQVTAFLAMEVAERLAARVPLGQLAHGPLVPVGIAAQIAMATLGALVVFTLCRAADRAAAVLGSAIPPPRILSAGVAVIPAARPARIAVPVATGRGPPSAL